MDNIYQEMCLEGLTCKLHKDKIKYVVDYINLHKKTRREKNVKQKCIIALA